MAPTGAEVAMNAFVGGTFFFFQFQLCSISEHVKEEFIFARICDLFLDDWMIKLLYRYFGTLGKAM